jgi:hypothetical protein
VSAGPFPPPGTGGTARGAHDRVKTAEIRSQHERETDRERETHPESDHLRRRCSGGRWAREANEVRCYEIAAEAQALDPAFYR